MPICSAAHLLHQTPHLALPHRVAGALQGGAQVHRAGQRQHPRSLPQQLRSTKAMGIVVGEGWVDGGKRSHNLWLLFGLLSKPWRRTRRKPADVHQVSHLPPGTFHLCGQLVI